MQTQQTQNSFPGPKSYGDFWETGPRTAILVSRHNDTGSRTVLSRENLVFVVLLVLESEVPNVIVESSD